ncbi:4Fe-4S dicluster domain-containing protein [Anaerobacillus alkalilacustris]|nr:4Fe-4S dicluster domain-containing protein [Anaerobacillus alkalilacustris]
MKTKVSRRAFLKKTATLCSGAAILSSGLLSLTSLVTASNGNTVKVKFGMIIDNTKCIGCGLCQEACATRHELPEGEYFIKLYKEYERGTYPNIIVENITTQCNHCENAPCARICPTGATYLNDQGIMVMNAKKCIGCKGCITACPYNARIWSEKFGTPEKCNFCDGFVQAGKDPACVTACPREARIFGDLNDVNSQISKNIIERRLEPLKPELGTKPKIYYVRHK